MLRTRESPQAETFGGRKRDRLWSGLTAYLAVFLLVLGAFGLWLRSERQRRLDAALLAALQRQDRAGMYRLVQAGASPRVSYEWGMTAFTFAVERGDLDLIALLFRRGVTPDTPVDHSMAAAIDLAALSGQLGVVKVLVERGVSPSRPSRRGDLPLVSAARAGRRRVVDFLLAKGASPTMADASGLTPLHAAVLSGDEPLVRLFLARGADPNTYSGFAITPLMDAARRGDTRIVQSLLKAGADPRLKNARGETAAALAAKKGHPKSAHLLNAALRP